MGHGKDSTKAETPDTPKSEKNEYDAPVRAHRSTKQYEERVKLDLEARGCPDIQGAECQT